MHGLDDVGIWLQLGSGLLIAGLGGFTLAVRPRSPATVAFGGFAILFGLHYVAVNGSYFFHQPAVLASEPTEILRIVARLAVIGATAVLALLFPERLQRGQRRLAGIPAVLVVIAFGAYLSQRPIFGGNLLQVWALHLANLMVLTLSALVLVFTLRATTTRDPDLRARCVYASAGLYLYTGLVATGGVILHRDLSIYTPYPAALVLVVATTTISLLLAILWIVDSGRSSNARTGRNMAIFSVAMPAAGLLYVTFDLDIGGVGIGRTLALAVLTYAIVRHRLLGIDVKLRWGISKGTLAAIFVTVFFIATETAQQFFDERLGSLYGILVTGALVFAITPLSRVADRLAETAIPGAPPSPSRDEAVFKAALRAALADGDLTSVEEEQLAQVQEHLGVRPLDALRWHREVAEELADGPRVT